MTKRSPMAPGVFYLLRPGDIEAKAFKLTSGSDSEAPSIVRVYSIVGGACNCTGAASGTCKHELMARSQEQYREFGDDAMEALRTLAQATLSQVIEDLVFRKARASRYKEGMYDALIFAGTRARASYTQLRHADRVLVAFFDPDRQGVPYYKAIVLLENYAAQVASSEAPVVVHIPPGRPEQRAAMLAAALEAIEKVRKQG